MCAVRSTASTAPRVPPVTPFFVAASAGTLAVAGGSAFLVARPIAKAAGAAHPVRIGLLAAGAAMAGVTALALAHRDTIDSLRMVAGDDLPLNQGLMVLRHATKPWLGGVALDAFRDAKSAALEVVSDHSRDGGWDAYQHAFGSGMLVGRLVERGVPLEQSLRIADQFGVAREDDRTTDPDDLARQMDLHNNGVGRDLARELIEAGTYSERELAEHVGSSLGAGRLRVVDAGNLTASRAD